MCVLMFDTLGRLVKQMLLCADIFFSLCFILKHFVMIFTDGISLELLLILHSNLIKIKKQKIMHPSIHNHKNGKVPYGLYHNYISVCIVASPLVAIAAQPGIMGFVITLERM